MTEEKANRNKMMADITRIGLKKKETGLKVKVPAKITKSEEKIT